MRLPGFATRNFRLKLVATVLAMVTWAGVVYAANPPGIRTASVPVPQDFSSLPPGFVKVRHISDLSVRLAGTQDHLNAFNLASLVVKVHYETIAQPGTRLVPVDIRNNDANVELDNPPTSVEVDIDRLATANVTVRVIVNPGPPPGYVKGTVEATPGQITVTGPAQELNGAEVRTRVIDLSNQKANFEQDITVFPYDGAGNRLGDVSVSQPNVRVLITIAAVSTQRASAVLPPVRGQVATGFRLSGITVSPATITVSGSQDILNGLDTIATDPVDISGLAGIRTFKVMVRTPAGVSASPDQVTVSVNVASLPSSAPPASGTPAPT